MVDRAVEVGCKLVNAKVSLYYRPGDYDRSESLQCDY